MRAITLEPVDALEVLILVDNVSDALLASTEVARRPPAMLDPKPDHLLGEHGYSLLLTVERGGSRESLLYDAGWSRETALHNLDVLGIAVKDLRTIVLSHGHGDHHGGLSGMVSRVGRRGLPLLLHPDAWLDRKIVFPDGREIPAPPPSHADLDREGVEVIEEKGPTLLIDGAVLVTGEVERKTDFEPGFPVQYRRRGHDWEPDYMVWDDQGVIVDVKGKGLNVHPLAARGGASMPPLRSAEICGYRSGGEPAGVCKQPSAGAPRCRHRSRTEVASDLRRSVERLSSSGQTGQATGQTRRDGSL